MLPRQDAQTWRNKVKDGPGAQLAPNPTCRQKAQRIQSWQSAGPHGRDRKCQFSFVHADQQAAMA